jgi:hypothetical protein
MKTLTVEIVEYYPYENKPYLGMLHIYVIEYGMDIRGVKVYRSGANIRFNLPFGNGIDPETKEKVSFPFVCFSDPDTWTSLKKELFEKGHAFMKENHPHVYKEKRLPVKEA